MRILVTVLVSLFWNAWARADLYSDCTQRRDLDLTIRACTQIIEESGRVPSDRLSIAYKSRGDSYFANGDYERAISDLGMAITLSPQDADAYIKRGMAYDAKGDFQHGIEDFGMAISLRPASATPYTMRGGAYERAGDKERAIDDFQRALEIDPSLETVRDVLLRLKSQ
jgi:tetratricopeptide (TPR) repeat protein